MLYASNKIMNDAFDKELVYKRMRIPVKIIYRNEEMAQRAVSHMLMLKGVSQCSANPITSKLLVIFDEYLLTEKAIAQHLKMFINKTRISKQGTIIQLNNNKSDMEVALPLAVENLVPSIHTAENSLWHYIDSSVVEKALGTNIKSGLSRHNVIKQTEEFGLNVLSEKKRKSLLAKFLENLGDFSTKLLIGVSVASFLIGQIADGIAVLGIVLLETALSTAQQNKAEHSIYSLKDMMVHKSKVIRNGFEQEIDAKYLVPGDIILFEAGEKVPADARIIECNDLKTSEASLTGESLPILKSSKACPKQAVLADRLNMLYMGTNILSGRGKAIVVATGMHTEIGKIAAMLQNINTELTPLQKRMMHFTHGLTKLCLSLCLVAGAGGLMMGKTLGEILTMGISFAIGAMPESLPALVTVAMASSVQKMAKKNAIVRKLPSVETLGSANVICCDKTGTLTMNEMTVRKIYVDNSYYDVSGTGYEPKGKISLREGALTTSASIEELLKYGVLCSNANLVKQSDTKWIVQGDPTEGALITAAKKWGLDTDYLKTHFDRLQEMPFDSSRRCMTVVVDSPEGKIAICKGALSSVIKNCKTVYEEGEEKLLTSSHKKKFNEICSEMGESALRVLAFSFKKLGASANENLRSNHILMGIVGMEDPPREGVKKSIKKCHNAGIKVVMITGDNKNTAAAIGRDLGILTDGLVLTGSELESMSDEDLDSNIKKVQIFARTSPEQKLRVVKAFKQCGYVVGMTGDGVNDAPAIKEADIGIAMGSNGSDVAKDAASITLVDDNFSTIVSAIEEGRAVSNNIRRSVKYLLSGSLGEMIAIFLTAGITGSLPLLSIQILWVNVICESILGSPLAVEAPSEDVMNSPPIQKDAPIIDKELKIQVLRRSAGIGLSTFAAFEIAQLLGMGIAKARTLAFTNLVLTQMVNCYDCRNNKTTLPSKHMSMALVSSSALFAGILYVPPVSSLLGTVPLNVKDWALVSSLAALSRI